MTKFEVLDMEVNSFAPPEKVLWLAVIERAILDAVYPTQELSVNHKHTLHGFFFQKDSRPYNLTYICDNLFDYPDAAKTIRRRLIKLLAAEGRLEFIKAKRLRGYY